VPTLHIVVENEDREDEWYTFHLIPEEEIRTIIEMLQERVLREWEN
jgi:hypothetical protein